MRGAMWSCAAGSLVKRAGVGRAKAAGAGEVGAGGLKSAAERRAKSSDGDMASEAARR